MYTPKPQLHMHADVHSKTTAAHACRCTLQNHSCTCMQMYTPKPQLRMHADVHSKTTAAHACRCTLKTTAAHACRCTLQNHSFHSSQVLWAWLRPLFANLTHSTVHKWKEKKNYACSENHQFHGQTVMYVYKHMLLANPNYTAFDHELGQFHCQTVMYVHKHMVLANPNYTAFNHELGQFHGQTVIIYIRCIHIYMAFLAGKPPWINGHAHCIYTVLANPMYSMRGDSCVQVIARNRLICSIVHNAAHLLCVATYVCRWLLPTYLICSFVHNVLFDMRGNGCVQVIAPNPFNLQFCPQCAVWYVGNSCVQVIAPTPFFLQYCPQCAAYLICAATAVCSWSLSAHLNCSFVHNVLLT